MCWFPTQGIMRWIWPVRGRISPAFQSGWLSFLSHCPLSAATLVAASAKLRLRESVSLLGIKRNSHKKAQKSQKNFCEFCAFLWLLPSLSAHWINRQQRHERGKRMCSDLDHGGDIFRDGPFPPPLQLFPPPFVPVGFPSFT